MKRWFAISLVALATLAVTSGALATPADSKNFVAPLRGDQEVPPVETAAIGVATFQLSEDATELGFKLIVANIEDVTQAHIHCGAFGVNGPVVVFLFGFDPAGATVNGILAQGTLTGASVIPRLDSAACPGSIASLSDVVAKMRTGGAYVNVHTLAHPAGQIRGQVKEAGAPD